ncbi:MAG: hypothetical protein PVF70_10480 [Anaerolineales bacterium]
MRNHRFRTVLMLAAVWILAACTTQQAPADQDTSTEPSPTTPSEATTPAEVEEPLVEVIDECIACHSDKDRLIDTAAPEEPVEVESTGEG